jgi:hypothetical protein
MGNNIWLDRQNQAVCSLPMTDEPANDMKRRAQEALARKLAAKTEAQAGSGKGTDKSGSATKGAKQPKQRIIRHQGR